MTMSTHIKGLYPQLGGILIAATLGLCLIGSAQAWASPVASWENSSDVVLSPETHQHLQSFLLERNYTWKTLKGGVPSFILESFPEDLQTMEAGEEKKKLFFLSLLPMTLKANDEILQKRLSLLRINEEFASNGAITQNQVNFVIGLAREYGLDANPFADAPLMDELIRRVDIIPPSLVLAQSANESGYGCSRFTQSAKNLFGEYTYTIAPSAIPGKNSGRVRQVIKKFDSLYASVRSYIQTLNTHWAYLEFRNERGRLREAEQPLTGMALAEKIERYSVRGQHYIRDIKTIILNNSLGELNDLTLRNCQTLARDIPSGKTPRPIRQTPGAHEQSTRPLISMAD